MRWFCHQGFQDLGQFFWWLISHSPNAGYYGPEWHPLFVHFLQAIEFGGTCPCGIEPSSITSLFPPSALMLFKMDMSLFLYLVVGSLEMGLYAGWSSNSWAFLIYSSLSITTKDTPLSAVRMILLLSFLSSANAFLSSLVMFDFGGCIFFRIVLISPLSSSTSPCFSYCKVGSLW